MKQHTASQHPTARCPECAQPHCWECDILCDCEEDRIIQALLEPDLSSDQFEALLRAEGYR